MNKEYMYLSDGKVAVTDEEGNIEIREFENNSFVKQILQYENADEFFDNELKKYKKNLDEQQRVQYLCKKMIKLQPLIVVLFTLFGFRFMFYSNDHEPIHVHVIKDEHEAKFCVDPVQLVENNGLKTSELRLAESVIEENKEIIINRWNEYFKK